ncbi:MAG: hypothetical protein RLY20_129, partial [Verrucomicrobiota bacterium]
MRGGSVKNDLPQYAFSRLENRASA